MFMTAYLLTMLNRSACLCSELVHSNVVRFVEAFPLSTPTCTTLCVVTELAAGGNLWTLMECCPLSTSEIQVARKSTWNVFPLTEPTARCVIQQCLLALQYLHAQGNYGCSLTPQSVLMSQWWMQRDALPGEQRSDFAPVVVLGGFNYVTNELLPRGSASSQVRSHGMMTSSVKQSCACHRVCAPHEVGKVNATGTKAGSSQHALVHLVLLHARSGML